MVTMVTKQKIFINFTFYETFKDEPISHKNSTLLDQGSHETPGGRADPPPPPPVFDVGTNTLGNRRVNTVTSNKRTNLLIPNI